MDHQQLTYTERIAELAARDPEAVGLICIDESGAEKPVTYSVLARRSAQVARLLASKGVTERTVVAVALPNGLDHVLVQFAAWWLGACVMPVNYRAPHVEQVAVLKAAQASGRPLLLVGQSVGQGFSTL